MDQLSALDQQFLAVESATNSGHIAGVYLLDPPDRRPAGCCLADLRALVGERLHLDVLPLRRLRP